MSSYQNIKLSTKTNKKTTQHQAWKCREDSPVHLEKVVTPLWMWLPIDEINSLEPSVSEMLSAP